jgi:hypothetical protein
MLVIEKVIDGKMIDVSTLSFSLNAQSVKITCLTNTYGRVSKLQQVIYCFINQTFKDAKLIINNQGEPLTLSDELKQYNIEIINTQKPYIDYKAVLDDVVYKINSEYMCFWDDDDLYLPNHLKNLYDFFNNDYDYIKPKKFYMQYDNRLEINENVGEPSCLIKTKVVKEVGFNNTDVPSFTHRHWIQRPFSVCDSMTFVYRIIDYIPHLSGKENNLLNFRKVNVDFSNDVLKSTFVDFKPYLKCL